MLKRMIGRPPLGWDGQKFENGEEGDWLLDLTYRIAQLDQLLVNGMPTAVRLWMTNDVAAHVVMSVDETAQKEYTEQVFAMLLRYPSALQAIQERLDNDTQAGGYRIITKAVHADYTDWFSLRVDIARRRAAKEAQVLV